MDHRVERRDFCNRPRRPAIHSPTVKRLPSTPSGEGQLNQRRSSLRRLSKLAPSATPALVASPFFHVTLAAPSEFAHQPPSNRPDTVPGRGRSSDRQRSVSLFGCKGRRRSHRAGHQVLPFSWLAPMIPSSSLMPQKRWDYSIIFFVTAFRGFPPAGCLRLWRTCRGSSLLGGSSIRNPR